MSIEKAKEFLIKISTDAEVGRKVDRAYFDVLLKVAQEHGYAVSESDLSEAVEKLASSGELSETELEQVAGSIINASNNFVADSLTRASSRIGAFLRFTRPSS